MDVPALVHHFSVVVDAVDLGAFTECTGLSASYALFDWREGGENGYVHKLWGPVSYTDITLARPIDTATAAVAAWVSSFATSRTPTNARIAALDPAGAPIAAWSVRGVVPRSWSGPSWSAGQNAVAKETLVLAHSGFTLEGGGAPAPTGAVR